MSGVCVCVCLHVCSEPSPAPLCKECLEKGSGSPVTDTATAGQGPSKVVTFGGVTELQQPISTVPSGQGEESELLKRMLAKATVAMPTIDMGSPLTKRAHRYGPEQNRDKSQVSSRLAVEQDHTGLYLA